MGCQENPCAGEPVPSISWPNTKGCFRLPPYAISNPSDCFLFLNDEDQLECDDEFGLRGVGSSAGRSPKIQMMTFIQNFKEASFKKNLGRFWIPYSFLIGLF